MSLLESCCNKAFGAHEGSLDRLLADRFVPVSYRLMLLLPESTKYR
jgi:hypothetical protein